MGLKYRDPNTGSFKELTIKASDTLPIGSMVPYGNIKPPTGWLVCDGRTVSRTTYADLFAVIGTSYGAGDGSTTFNLPNKKGRVSAGYDSTNNKFNTIGKHTGEEMHALVLDEMPKHNHASYSIKTFYGTDGQGVNQVSNVYASGTNSENYYTLNYDGKNQPHNNIQPTEVDQWIIKAFQSIGVVAKVAQTETENNTDVYSCEYINNKLSNLSKTSIETGDTPPSNPSDGDLWIDTSDNGKLAEIDNEVSTTSNNAIANQAITNYVNNKISSISTEKPKFPFLVSNGENVLPSFENKIYYAEYGMTFNDWVNSEYNNGEYPIFIDADGYVNAVTSWGPNYHINTRYRYWEGNHNAYNPSGASSSYVEGSHIIIPGIALEQQCCFLAGSQILINLNGTTKNIEDLKENDQIVIYNEDTQQFELSTITRYITKQGVTDQAQVILENDISVTMHAYHPLLTTDGYHSITNFEGMPTLTENDTLITVNGPVKIKKIIRTTIKPTTMYNLSVESSYHNFIVNSIVSHNAPMAC